MSDEWVSTLPSMVYSRTVAEFSSKIKNDYNMTGANFSTEMSSDVPSIFPFASFEQVDLNVVEEDLERTQINEVLFTLKVDVYDNQSQQRARAVAFEILRIMRKMKFTPIPAPIPIKDGSGVHRFTARYQIRKDWNDVL